MNAVESTPQQLAWLAYCRAGFERDLAEELQQQLQTTPVSVVEQSGYVIVSGSLQTTTPKRLSETSVADLTFARQLILTHQPPVALTGNDRVNPIFEALQAMLQALHISAVTDCWVEYPDTNDGKVLSRAAKAIAPRLIALCESARLIAGHARYRAHVFLTPEKTAWVGLADMSLGAPDPLGIVRIRMPHDAPSRSTMKLAEAIQVFLGDTADKALQPDMRAVDLGAAPGGWTWQLITRGLRVTAVDNGPLKGDLVDNAMVKHLRMDGFKYQPTVPVDWMVCDMMESPSRIAKLVATWLVVKATRNVIFNLKLPMKKRNEEVARCRCIIEDACADAGLALDLRLKQLYHDREEITGYAAIISLRGGSGKFAHNRSANRDVGRRREASPAQVKLPPAASKPAPPQTPTVPRDNVQPSQLRQRESAVKTHAGITSPWAAKPPVQQKTRKSPTSKLPAKPTAHKQKRRP